MKRRIIIVAATIAWAVAGASADEIADRITQRIAARYAGVTTAAFLAHCDRDAVWCGREVFWIDTNAGIRGDAGVECMSLPPHHANPDAAYYAGLGRKTSAWMNKQKGITPDAPAAIELAIRKIWPEPCKIW